MSGDLTPAERSLRARAAAYRLHSMYDSRQLTANARAAFEQRFARQVDPEGYCPKRNVNVAPSAPARPTTPRSLPSQPEPGETGAHGEKRDESRIVRDPDPADSAQTATASASTLAGSGIGRPSSARPSRCKGMPSRISCST